MQNKISKRVIKITAGLLTLLSVLSYFPFLGMTNVAQSALVPGGSVGPVVPSGLGKGFPAWYMDQNGLALEVMEAADGFGISDPVDPANPFSQELGFNAEGFYWVTEGAPANPHGISLMVLALEMAFAGEAAVDGEQSVFGRIRFRFDVGEPGTYTIRHPFGTNVYNIDTVLPGAPEINDSSDIGCFATAGILSCDPNNPPGNPNNFGLALNSLIGPFLTWDTFNLDPALTDPALINPAFPGKRYVGNPGVSHAIKGSPVGQNFIRVEGPNIGGPGINFIEETQFAVAGRIAVVDTVPPVIASVAPAEIIVDALGQVAANTVISANITDDLGVRAATIDLTVLGDTLTSSLNGAQEVPTTASAGTGSGAFTIDTNANTLNFNISYIGLQGGAETAAHIHGPAVAGVNALPVFDLPLGASKIGVWNYPENLEADILAGRMYINIHTTLFPNGEIRGQILRTPNIQNMIRNAGTVTDGTWSIIIPSIPGVGTYSFPISTHDGANITNLNFVLSVVNPAPVANPDGPVTIGTNIGESATIAVLANDADSNGNLPLSLVSVQNVSIGTGVVSGNDVVITSPTNVFAGTITAQYTVADSLGATSNGDITVTVVRDVTPPVITINGANPMAVVAGTPYVEPGIASVIDDFDGVMPIASVQIVSTVPAGNLVLGTGPFTVTYSIADAVGNLGTVVRTINVETPVFSSINVTPAINFIVINQTKLLNAVALDQAGNPLAIQPVFTWISSNNAVSTVSGAGLVTGVSLGGPVTITASATVGAATLSQSSQVTVSACETSADTDGSGNIGNLEILNHVRAWKNGTVPNLEILNAIRFWKAGTGC